MPAAPPRRPLRQYGFELYLGIVRAVGTQVGEVVNALTNALEQYNVRVRRIRLAERIFGYVKPRLPARVDDLPQLRAEDPFGYYELMMNAGDKLRRENPSLVAFLAISRMQELRKTHLKEKTGHRGAVYIFDSLMHSGEVEALRQIYGDRFFLLGIYESEDRRLKTLTETFQQSARKRNQSAESLARRIMLRDRGSVTGEEVGAGRGSHRLSIEDTFFLSDVFIAITDDTPITLEEGESSDSVLRRLFRQLFSYPVGVPSGEEQGMAFAYLAARSTAALSRRVGAAIMSEGDELLAVGANEVPQFGGGQYGGEEGWRDHEYTFEPLSGKLSFYDKPVEGADSNDVLRMNLIYDFLYRLSVITDRQIPDGRAIRRETLRLVTNRYFKESEVMDLITLSRTVHAEMAALTSAQRQGISVAGATVYTTTFPCHECTRHLLASGIVRVVYVEPYPKSKTWELHRDAVNLGIDGKGLVFQPFIGIAPRRQDALFSMTERKWRPRMIGVAQDIGGGGQALRYGQSLHRGWRMQGAPVRDSVIPDEPLASAQESQARRLEVAYLKYAP